MKIILIIPPYKVSERFGLPYPMGIGYVGTVLKRKGYDVRIIDCDAMKLNLVKLRKLLSESRPDMVGVTATSYTRFSAINVINIVKSVLPDTYTVVGGPHFTATADDALRVVESIDFVVRGEGENTILELICALEKKGNLNKIDGLSFRENGKIIHNKNRQYSTALDQIPMLDRELIDSKLYYEKLPHSEMECKSVLTSRGCPFNCAFCFPHDRGYRRRSNANILDEVEYLLNRFQIGAIRFFDLTFTISNENVKDFCAEIKKRRLNFKWYCESRVDIDINLLEIMKEAGCYSLDFGLESASKKVLKQINKKINPEQALLFAKKCKELDIKTRVFLMLSLPGEEVEDAVITYNFARELSKYVAVLGLQVTQIIPGTEVEQRAKTLKLLDENFSWNSPQSFPKAKIFTGTDVVPLYIEKLTFKEIQYFYQKYSVFELYYIKKVNVQFLKEKLLRGILDWDKNFIFKLKWLFLFSKVGLLKLFKPNKDV